MKPGDIVWFTEIGRYQNVYLSKSVITGQIDDEYKIKGIAGTMPAYKLFPTKEALVESFEIFDETQKISLT